VVSRVTVAPLRASKKKKERGKIDSKVIPFFVRFLLLLALSVMNPVAETFMGLSFSCLNVNSLNMASANKPSHVRKLYGILKLKTDFILMSDVRASNKSLVSSTKDLISIFRNNQYGSYSSFFNSTKNKRGVCILIKNDLTFSELDRRADAEENYLLLKLRIRGTVIILGAIYGPNNFDPNFFDNLETDITALGNHPVILAGDWNTTYSNLPVDLNPDCFNMANVPNLRHANLLKDMCSNLSLCDPFRALHPVERRFSFLPRSAGAVNKSRIDFF
jgi:exonuclease III